MSSLQEELNPPIRSDSDLALFIAGLSSGKMHYSEECWVRNTELSCHYCILVIVAMSGDVVLTSLTISWSTAVMMSIRAWCWQWSAVNRSLRGECHIWKEAASARVLPPTITIIARSTCSYSIWSFLANFCNSWEICLRQGLIVLQNLFESRPRRIVEEMCK